MHSVEKLLNRGQYHEKILNPMLDAKLDSPESSHLPKLI